MFTVKVIGLDMIEGELFQYADFNSLIVGRDFDAVVTPGNSFGIMDGGFDLVVAQRFPWVQDTLRRTMEREGKREIPVGHSVLVHTGNSMSVCYAPTMRFPGPVASKDAAFVAAFSAFSEIDRYNRTVKRSSNIETVVVPLLGTTTGGIPPQYAYWQIEYALQCVEDYRKPALYWDADLEKHRRTLFDLCNFKNTRTGE